MKNLNKLVLCVLGASLLLVKTVSAEESELLSKIKICSLVSESQARLSCYDALTNINTSSMAIVVPSKTVSTEKPPISAEEVDDFAKSHVQKSEEEQANEINSITLTISKLSKTVRGQWKLSFENGQQWQQKDAAKLRLKEGIKVILTKGALGAVYLQKEHSNKRIKVKRVK
jgi:hypothetical protein